MSDLQETSPICHGCVGDAELKSLIKLEGAKRRCAICSRVRASVTLRVLAERVDDVYRRYYVPGRDLSEIGQSGSYPEEIIAEMILDDGDGVADALADILSGDEYSDVYKEGGEAWYDSGSRYETNTTVSHPWELTEQWDEFQRSVKHGKRFLYASEFTYLDELLQTIEDAGIPSGNAQVAVLRTELLMRARRADSYAEARGFIKNPVKELGPPPADIQGPSRMNPAGISTFYGGFDLETCLSEIRPPVGSYVAFATFTPLRTLRALDFTAFDTPRSAGSMFDPAYDDRLKSLRFLRKFQRLISRPVQRAREMIEYVPTQVVAEYLWSKAAFDGVIYQSAQQGRPRATESREGHNIALFNAEGIVRRRRPRNASRAGHSAPKPKLRYCRDSAGIVEIRGVDVKYSTVFDWNGQPMAAHEFFEDDEA